MFNRSPQSPIVSFHTLAAVHAILLFAGLILLTGPAHAGFKGTWEAGFDRPGGDYDTFQTTSATACRDACSADGNDCVAWTLDLNARVCRLKDTMFDKVEKKNSTSGVKTSAFRFVTQESHYDRPGGDYRSFSMRDASSAVCAQSCQNDNRCLAYTYVPQTGSSPAACWLKDSKPDKRINYGMVSGTKPGYSQRRDAMSGKSSTRLTGTIYERHEMASNEPKACRAICGSVATCEGWAFFKYQANEAPIGQCRHYSDVIDQISASSYYNSGTRRQQFEKPKNSNFTATTNSTGEFNASTFHNEIRNKLNRYQGYGLVVMDSSGREVYTLSDGFRIHSMTGQASKAFSVDTPTRIGSISKALTGVLVTKKEREEGGVFSTLIDRYLPERWELNGTFRWATYFTLLRHEAGIPNSGGLLREVLENDPEENTVGRYSYSNYGLESFNVSLAYRFFPDLMANVEASIADYDDATYDHVIRMYAAAHYRYMMETELFEPLGIDAACDPTDFARPSYLYSKNVRDYSVSSDDSYSMSNLGLHCAQGAWMMSTRDLARFWHTVMNTNQILDAEGRSRLKPNVISSAYRTVSLFHRELSGGRGIVSTHNGAHPGAAVFRVGDGTPFSSSVILLLPGGYTAAFNANSPKHEGEDPYWDIIHAFSKARGF